MRYLGRKSGHAGAVGFAVALCLSGGVTTARADTVLDWNATAAGLPIVAPPVLARVMATMHGAVHDAVNAIEPRYEAYRAIEAPPGASIDAAAAP